MLFDFTPVDLKDLRWLLETVIADQEHFLEDETDPGAIREAIRAKRGAARLLKRLARPQCRSFRVRRNHADELTRTQLAQQDAVDNAIHRLLNELRPQGMSEIPWCQSCLAVVRYAVLKALREHTKITDEEFYPALGDRAEPRRVGIQVVSKRDANGDSEIRLVPVQIERGKDETDVWHRVDIDLVTLLNCAEADLLGFLDSIDVSAQDKEHPTAQTVRDLHAALRQVQPSHTCGVDESGGAP